MTVTIENLRNKYRLDEVAVMMLARISDLRWVARQLIIMGCPVSARLTARTLASLAFSAVPELREDA